MKTAATNSRFTLIFIFHFSLFVFHFSLFTFHASLTHAQTPTVQDCLGAIPVCQEIYVEENSYSGDGNYHNEIYEDLPCDGACPGSCLAGEINSVWYILTVQESGLLRMIIDPVDNDDDYDWAVYDLTDLRCSDIYSNYPQMQRSCNAYGQLPNGNTGISTAQGGSSNCNNCGGTNKWNADLAVTEGETYVLVVENWSGTTQGYTLDFSASTAIIFDDAKPELAFVLSDGISCSDNEIIFEFSENVLCESVDPTDFQLTGPGDSYTILDVQGEACMVGGEMEKHYTLFLDQPFISSGIYSLQLVPESDVHDACNNVAVADTIVFNLDLGAPVVIDTAIVITPAAYGINDGQITGLIVNGNEPLSYRWYDHFNDTVGTNLDLIDVYSGSYFLEITDSNGCETMAGPYFVDLVEDITEAEASPTGITVFPNPNPGIFTIQVNKDVARISVINMMGTILHTYGKEKIIGGTIQADLRKDGPGIYLIQAATDSGRVLNELVEVF
jgi:hypothetical protein